MKKKKKKNMKQIIINKTFGLNVIKVSDLI